VPDRFDRGNRIIEEIKGGKGPLRRRDIEQIKDFVRYARANRFKVIVTTRRPLGTELERLRRSGDIVVRKPRRVIPRGRQA
jgi:hypothetical protein